MIKILRHPLFISAAAAAVLYLLFAHLLDPPVPGSLVLLYMIVCVIGILLVATFDDDNARRMAAPIAALLGDPGLKWARALALAVVVLGVAGVTYSAVRPSGEAPIELRSVHPAPPSTLRVYGKTLNLIKLTNPLRAEAPKGSEKFRKYVGEGAALYYKNCLFCHGDALSGKGVFAGAFNPRPANFQDIGTIAQLQESYLFWRIATGGPGLPREAAPWSSAMPVWHRILKENDIWKIILFLYDYTGHEPRTWELEGGTTGAGEKPKPGPAKKSKSADGKLGEAAVKAIYMRRCAHCHGEEGDGLGPVAKLMYPKPRDFTLGTFKYKTTHADDEFPTDADLRKTILEGLTGTAMPGWRGILSDAEIAGLIGLIKEFGEWEEIETKRRPIDYGKPVPSSGESIARGRKLFVKACVQCHGPAGRGNITSGKKLKDDWKDRIWPRNLTRPDTWRYTRGVKDIFERISGGIRGTPMPEHSTTMKTPARWDIANYVMTLRRTAVPTSRGRTVISAARIEGALPTSADDPRWAKAPVITFPLAPNIVREPRIYFSLNDTLTVRALHNGKALALLVDVDDRTYSVPGDALERRYRIKGIKPTADAFAVQFPAALTKTSEKPWFRHGDPRHAVNIWYWRAPSVTPKKSAATLMFDATGPGKRLKPRQDSSALTASGKWKDGRWRVVFRRDLLTKSKADLQISSLPYIPIAFANWDGVAGQAGARHAMTPWYWLKLESQESSALSVFGTSGGAGLFAGLLFLGAARRQRRRFKAEARPASQA
ncbi:MAG: c-type cytochrome [Alphaproteobacteria bacterium]